MARERCEFVDSRLRRCPPDRASAVPYGQAGENALRFPHLAHRSAAAHKPHSAATAARIVFDSGKGETLRPAIGLSLFFPDPVQTAGTTAEHGAVRVAAIRAALGVTEEEHGGAKGLEALFNLLRAACEGGKKSLVRRICGRRPAPAVYRS